MHSQPSQRKSEVLVTMSLSHEQLDRLKERCEVVVAGWGLTGNRLDEDALCSMVQDVDILLVGYENISARVIQSARNLKIIGISRSNPVNVDINAANVRGIPVLHTPGRNAIAAAEYTMGLMLSQARNISSSDRALRNRNYLGHPKENLYRDNLDVDVTWDLDGDTPYLHFRGFELNGHTLGLIGFGNVAAKVAHLAQAFGMRVITFTQTQDAERAAELGVEMVDLTHLLRESDFISVHCSVTPETRSLLDDKAFALMKSSAYLINTARASIIDQAALINALINKQIRGAALDVFWYEPLPDNHPLLDMENVTITPHIAGSTYEVPERHARMLVDDVLTWLNGNRPTHIFNAEALH